MEIDKIYTDINVDDLFDMNPKGQFYYNIHSNGGFHSCAAVLYINKNKKELEDLLILFGIKPCEIKQGNIKKIKKEFFEYARKCYEFSCNYIESMRNFE